MSVFLLRTGSTPLLVSMPHTATAIPPELAARMTPAGRAVPDTDWHIHRLYDFAIELGASVLRHFRSMERKTRKAIQGDLDALAAIAKTAK